MQVHRFRNAAALALAGKGETRYLTADEAERAGRALVAIAESIRRERFGASHGLTTRFETSAEYITAPDAPNRTPAAVPRDWPVRPIRRGTVAADAARDLVTCGTCGRSWDDAKPTAYTPAPAGRCPFEAFHVSE